MGVAQLQSADNFDLLDSEAGQLDRAISGGRIRTWHCSLCFGLIFFGERLNDLVGSAINYCPY